MLWIALAACNGKDDASTDTSLDSVDTDDTDTVDTDDTDPPDPTGETASTAQTGDTGGTTLPDPDVLAASCALSAANPLRIECTATLVNSGSATVTFSTAGVDTRTFQEPGPAIDHDLLGWGLKPDTAYDWAIGTHGGTVTTGSLDPELASGADILVTGDPLTLGFDAILQPLECSAMFLVMIDHDGDIVWYEQNEAYNGRRDGYEWMQDSRSVLSIGSGLLLETHVSGDELLRLERNVHFDGDLHHDLTRWGAYTYVLYEERVNSLNVDGIYTFDGTTQVGDFFLGDLYAIPAKGNGDWSHANGLNADDDGTLVMSLWNFDNVLAIEGDPSAKTYLDIEWIADGTGQGLPNPDYVPAKGAREGWEAQHNARLKDGQLWLFDNTGIGGRSRGLRLDFVGNTLQVDAEWELDVGCPIQGGTLDVDGGVVLSCTNLPAVYAFEETGVDPIWTLEATCTSPADTLVRGIPIVIE